jgi:hypothetical protein
VSHPVRLLATLLTLSLPLGAVALGAQQRIAPDAPSPDPRVGLKAGWFDAGEAIWNLQRISSTKPSSDFTNPSTPGDARLKNSDLAFIGTHVIQGNYSGYQIIDIANPAAPRHVTSYVCPGSQSDVSVYRHLMFVSHEANTGRIDCGLGGVPDTVSAERARGVRIYDITDISAPKSIAMVQTCRGSHTHTLVTDPKDPAHVYVYVSGSAPVRSPTELSGCSGAPIEEDPSSALFRIEVIQVPLANPAAARIVSSPRIFRDLSAPPEHAANAVPGAPPSRQRGAPTQCHDITVYPAIGLAGGACAGYGLLLDIRDVKNPVRVGAVADENFSFWHSATFNNDGTKVLFTDEWGGGTQPRCRDTDKMEWGANALFTLENNVMTFKSYFKMPAAQTANENCVAHNGSLIPIPGRDVMVQAWYQGGISILDWTDIEHPIEIAYHDRGPMDDTKLVSAGSWSVYWYNGLIVSSEIARGLDIFALTPSRHITQNEIDAANTVRFEQLNVQEQPKITWPPSFAKARAFVDQLERSGGLSAERLRALRTGLAGAESAAGGARRTALTQLAGSVNPAASSDAGKARLLVEALRELAGTGDR